MVKSLQEDLKFWRAERPDEWTMDEFIRKAKKLESSNAALLEALELVRDKLGTIVEMNMNDEDVSKIDAAIAAARGE